MRLIHSFATVCYSTSSLNLYASSPYCIVICLCSKYILIASTNLSLSLQGTINPLSSPNNCLAPPGDQSVEIHGIPIHIASINEFGNSSKSEVRTKQ